jgi:radical SAM protein with 4Fe4S-binding SPASM domain
MKRPHDEMGTEECKKIIDDMARIGVGLIGWTGGEPLLRQDLEDLISYARKRGIKSNITTNAVLLDEDRVINLKAAGTTAIQISLDGSTPEANRRMRGTTDEEFDKIIGAVHHCQKHDVNLYLATLVGQENLDEARAMIEFAKSEGMDKIRLCGYTPIGRGKTDRIRERFEFNERLSDLFYFAKQLQKDASFLALFDPPFGPVPPSYRFHECIAGKETFYLKGNGDLYPCTTLLHRRFRVGNIRERSLEDLWNDPAMEEIANFPRETIEGPCRDCDNFSRCRGACRGVTFAHTGDLKASFPVCLYQFALEAITHS